MAGQNYQFPNRNQEQQSSNEGRPATFSLGRYNAQKALQTTYPQIPAALQELAKRQLAAMQQQELLTQASSTMVAASVAPQTPNKVELMPESKTELSEVEALEFKAREMMEKAFYEAA